MKLLIVPYEKAIFTSIMMSMMLANTARGIYNHSEALPQIHSAYLGIFTLHVAGDLCQSHDFMPL